MGLFLGGGVGFLSPQHGFAADTFKEIDVVLTNGELVTTSSNEHKDLFRALKGGLNRFGIVTRYEVQAIHTGRKEDKTWYGGTIGHNCSIPLRLLKPCLKPLLVMFEQIRILKQVCILFLLMYAFTISAS